jgi:hypothetical protein
MIRRILHLLPVLAMLAVVAMAQLPTPIASTVTVNTNGVVIAPANFWQANSNLMTVAATPARGAVTNINWNAGHFIVSGTNVSLNQIITLTNNLTVEADSSAVEFSGLSTFTVSPSSGSYLSGDLYITNSPTAYIAAMNAWIEGRSSMRLYTPAVAAGTATGGQFLSLTDDANGEVEFVDIPGAGSYLALAGGTMSGTINMGSQRIVSLGAPSSTTDAATKLYVDQLNNAIESVTYAAAGATNVNNLDPGSTTATRVFVTRSGSIQDIVITGIVAPAHNNRLMILVNGNSGSMQLVGSGTSSTAANRFVFTADGAGASRNITIGPWDAALLFYEPGGSPRWKYLGTLSQGNNTIIQTSPSGVFVDALNRVTFGGPFERLVTAGFPFYGILELSTTTTTAVRMVELFNQTGSSVTIHHDAMPGGSQPVTQGILTPTGSGVTWPNLTAARFIYDKSTNRWRLLNGSF